ncbi:TRAP transporter small permease [Candidatus Palauibacter sp.]|uniref:TRAP transporter small permease n=1 Tax=Candidatus Palauibacter sp. TaxID=3101350 RepID=UPI003B029641
MTRRLRTLNRVLITLETFAVGVLLIAVCDVVLLQVLMRYLFAAPNPWSEEVSRFCFIWLSLLGASLAVARRAHFRFDQVTGRLAPRMKRGVEACARAAVLLFALLLIGTGIALMDLTMGERSAALNLPVALVYAAAPVSGVLMAIHMLAGWSGEGWGASSQHAPQQPGSTGETG